MPLNVDTLTETSIFDFRESRLVPTKAIELLTPSLLCPPSWQVPKSREGWFSTESTPIIQPVWKITTKSAVVCVFKYNARLVQQLIQDEEGGKRTFDSQVSIKILLEYKQNEEASDDFDLPLKTPEVNSVKGALGLINKLAGFSDWQGNEELCKAIACVKDVLVDSRLHSLKQSSIKSFFIKS